MDNVVTIPKPILVDITKLKRHPNNLKKHTKSQINTIVQLIHWVGFINPIVIDKNFNVKAGHGRLDAAEILEMKEVPCIFIEGLTKKQMDLFMYLDNHVNESPWIQDNIDLVFEDMPLANLEQFPDINWDNIIPTQEINEEPLPEPPKEPKTKLGDVYQLGNHRVMCGDSLTDLSKLMKNNAKLTITSPPYNMAENAGLTFPNKSSKYINSDDNLSNYDKFLTTFTKECLSNSDYVFVNIQLLSKNKIDFIKYLNEVKDRFVDMIIWDKGHAQPAMAYNVMNSVFEFILIFTNLTANRAINTGVKFRGTINNIIHINPNIKNEFSDIHSAAFPTELPQYLITSFSLKNDIILDPFLGTGTTLIACEQTDRICYGMELDPSYVDVCVLRWENFTGKKAQKV